MEIKAKMENSNTVSELNTFLDNLKPSVESGGRQFSYENPQVPASESRTKEDYMTTDVGPKAQPTNIEKVEGRVPLRTLLEKAVKVCQEDKNASRKDLEHLQDRIEELDKNATDKVSNLDLLSFRGFFNRIGIAVSSAFRRAFAYVSGTSKDEQIAKIHKMGQEAQRKENIEKDRPGLDNFKGICQRRDQYGGGGVTPPMTAVEANSRYTNFTKFIEISKLDDRIILTDPNDISDDRLNTPLLDELLKTAFPTTKEIPDPESTSKLIAGEIVGKMREKHVPKEKIDHATQVLKDNKPISIGTLSEFSTFELNTLRHQEPRLEQYIYDYLTKAQAERLKIPPPM